MSISKPQYASDFHEGTVLRNYVDPASGLRVLVVRSFASFCAYVGVQSDHPIAGLEELEFKCHFGITFQSWGRAGSVWPEGWYWWGWDYAHFTDALYLPWMAMDVESDELKQLRQSVERMGASMGFSHGQAPKKWTLDEVFEDAMDVLMHLKTALEHSDAQIKDLLHEMKRKI